MTPVITLLICDDHRLLTDALVHIVSSDDGIKLVADPVDNAEEAVALCAAHQPDVVLMDIELRGAVNGIEATRQVKAVSPLTKVVVVSGHRRRTVAVEAVEAALLGSWTRMSAWTTCSTRSAPQRPVRCWWTLQCWRACCLSWPRNARWRGMRKPGWRG